MAPRATLRFTSVTAENPLNDFPNPIVSNIVSAKLIPSALKRGKILRITQDSLALYSDNPK
jgi:hypothetical protein